MRTQKQVETIDQLTKQGFKLVNGHKNLQVNESGKVYDTESGKYLTPTKKNFIKLKKGYLNIAKLVLAAFEGEPYRSGQIEHRDKDKTNVSRKNVKYKRLFEPNQTNEVNKADLLTAIRCYFEVKPKYNLNDAIQTRIYLQMIIEKRGFFVLKAGHSNIETFKTYIDIMIYGLKSLAETAKEHNISVHDCIFIVNEFTNMLITDILRDLEKGLLHVHEYKRKQPTKTATLRQLNEKLTANGQTPVPLRKKSLKEKLKGFESGNTTERK